MASVGIVYLDRKGNHPLFRRAFLKSLGDLRSYADCTLFWQYKGFDTSERFEALDEARHAGLHVEELYYPDDLYQFSLAYDVAKRFDLDRFVFFISWSRILDPRWLSFYLKAYADHSDCGVVGATGSYESLPPHDAFPNIHLRTNAFMIKRSLLLDIDPGVLVTKEAGNLFEAGPNSLTRQILSRGLQPIVVDRGGRSYRSEEWPRSLTFRSGNQERLLVADNRTHDYSAGSSRRRLRRAQLSWGDEASVANSSYFHRWSEKLDWRFPGLLT